MLCYWLATGVLFFLATQSYFSSTVKCTKSDHVLQPWPRIPEQTKGGATSAGSSRELRGKDVESDFQSVAIEMILFPGPVHTGENCQQICDKWFAELENFIYKEQAGSSMLRHPLIFKKDGTRLRTISDLAPMDRTRASGPNSAFIDLTAADDALPRHNRDEGTLESMFRLDQGNAFNVENPEPVQSPLAQMVSETTEASEHVDSTAKPDKDLFDLISPML